MSLPDDGPYPVGGLTWVNWRNHPWQMWSLTALAAWSIGILVDPNAVIHRSSTADFGSPQTLNTIAAAVLVGSMISLLGLHMRDREFGVGAELSGYIVLLVGMAFYLGLSLAFRHYSGTFTRVGTAACLGFIGAMLHRTVQIIAYKRSFNRVQRLEAELAARVASPDAE